MYCTFMEYVSTLTCEVCRVRVVSSSYRTASEHHLILCQCASLVGEHILDLAQVLGDVESTALERHIASLVVHVQVPVKEVDLYNLDYFNGDIE